MKTIFKRISAAFAALAFVTAAVVFDLSAKTASAAPCDVDHSSATQLTVEPEQLTDGSSYYLGASIDLTKEIVIEGNVTLCLNGNTITAASNSRVFTIKNGGSLTICDCGNSGTITGGKADDGGGVYVNGGSFTMNGGTISQNTADHQGGGVFVSDGGVFTMNGGTISRNTATGLGDPKTNGGGGVYTAGTFTMSGNSKVSDNKAESCFGGGVLVSGPDANFTLESGTISGNSANYGGGVYISSSGTVTMNGGVIDGNTAGGGGGVCLGTINGAFAMTNGTITNNTSNYGGGIQMNGGTMTLDETITIKDNHTVKGKDSNVYLRETGKDAPTCFTITIGASFAPTVPIGVHIQPTIE